MEKNKLSVSLKSFIAICSVISVTIACVYAVEDGYSHWSKRLLYFTNQSNAWIGLTCIVAVIMLALKKENTKAYKRLCVVKFVFTVSITITGLIFCCFLAPFSYKENYNAWSIASIFAHVLVPVLSVVDFLLDDYKITFTKLHAVYCLIPPFLYFVCASVLSLLKVDFGRGKLYPYFFMNFNTEAGWFGLVKNADPPQVGTAYWLVLILGIILGISFLYRFIHNKQQNKVKGN